MVTHTSPWLGITKAPSLPTPAPGQQKHGGFVSMAGTFPPRSAPTVTGFAGHRSPHQCLGFFSKWQLPTVSPPHLRMHRQGTQSSKIPLYSHLLLIWDKYSSLCPPRKTHTQKLPSRCALPGRKKKCHLVFLL